MPRQRGLKVFICISQVSAQISSQLSSENMMSQSGWFLPAGWVWPGSGRIKDQPSANLLYLDFEGAKSMHVLLSPDLEHLRMLEVPDKGVGFYFDLDLDIGTGSLYTYITNFGSVS